MESDKKGSQTDVWPHIGILLQNSNIRDTLFF